MLFPYDIHSALQSTMIFRKRSGCGSSTASFRNVDSIIPKTLWVKPLANLASREGSCVPYFVDLTHNPYLLLVEAA